MFKKIILVIFLDQITKLFFSGRDFFIGPLHVHGMKNFGLSFAMNFGAIVNIVLIGLGFIFFIYYYRRHYEELSLSQHSAFAFIFAGAISNIIDRVVFGYVKDFLDLGLGFTFNFADVFITLGLILLLLPTKSGDKTADSQK